MRVWRLTRAVHASDPLSGRGAAVVGSRWSSPGIRVAYTSTSRALAVLEMLVHVTRETVPPDMVLVPVDVPDKLIREGADWPDDWAELPYGPDARAYGDRWASEQRSLGLLVPSVVLPIERNLLINPGHEDFGRLRIRSVESFAFDRRLFR